jgi:hypothetical protein
MRQGVVGVALAVIAAAGEVPVTAQDISRAVRPESAAVRAVMTRGIERSGTFRDLTGRLSGADVIIYVRFSRCAGDVPGCLLWASAAPGPRRVLIKLDQFSRSPNDLTALLAHELQHALEVADAPEIRDLASFQKAFAGRGWKGSDGFETAQAREITRRVTAELGSTSEAANGQARPWIPPAPSRTRIVAGTVVSGDTDPRTLAAAIEALPRRPERIVMVDTKDLPPAGESRLRELDAFVLNGSPVIYLRRQGQTLRAAEHSGGPYVLMLAVILWHEMAHTEGLDERQAQQREEDLWKAFTARGLVESVVGLTYLAELRQRR